MPGGPQSVAANGDVVGSHAIPSANTSPKASHSDLLFFHFSFFLLMFRLFSAPVVLCRLRVQPCRRTVNLCLIIEPF